MKLAIDSLTLLNVAQWLEARGDPMQSATELRALVAGAKPATEPDLVADMILELRAFGQCRGPVHVPKDQQGKPCNCRLCRVLVRLTK